MNFICPVCHESEGLKPQYGNFICSTCDRVFDYNYINIWNTGYKVGQGKTDDEGDKYYEEN